MELGALSRVSNMGFTAFVLLLASLAVNAQASSPDANQVNEQAKGLLSSREFAAAIPLLRQAAEAGVPEAQYNLGVCYLNGQGVEADASIANSWFERAAKEGWVDAQFKLAYSYATGRGIKKDLELAHRWCLAAAEQGDTECQFIVIGNYLEGRGVPKDVAKGLQWAKRLALRENPEDLAISGRISSARLNIARIYETGLWGVPIDLREAYKWLLLTNEGKRDFSTTVQREIIEELRTLEAHLSAEERTRGQHDAELLLKRKLQRFEQRFKLDL